MKQVVSEPTMKDVPLDLMFGNWEELVCDVMVGGCLGHREHEMMEYLVFSEVSIEISKTATLDFQRADFALFREQVNGVPWKVVLKGKGASGRLDLLQDILKAQEQVVLM